jgi:uncharacterized protein (TIGR02118 family)
MWSARLLRGDSINFVGAVNRGRLDHGGGREGLSAIGFTAVRPAACAFGFCNLHPDSAMFCLTVVYPAASDATFNFDYYVKTHMPMVAALIGESVQRTEVARGLLGYGGSPAPYTATGRLYLSNLDGMQAAFQTHGATIQADLANYTMIAPVVNIEEIIA